MKDRKLKQDIELIDEMKKILRKKQDKEVISSLLMLCSLSQIEFDRYMNMPKKT